MTSVLNFPSSSQVNELSQPAANYCDFDKVFYAQGSFQSRTFIRNKKSLYDQDFVAWAEQMAEALKLGDFNSLDLEHLIEEVQDLAKRDKRDLKSNLFVLLMHLLKWQFQPERRSYPDSSNDIHQNSWARTISEHRERIQGILEDSPSLRSFFTESLVSCYAKARKAAAKETGKDISIFPSTCEYTETQILDDDFWPG